MKLGTSIKNFCSFEIPARDWCLYVIFSLVGVVAGAIILTFVIDPHYRYRLPRFYDTVYYEIYATGPRLLKDLKYDTFFLGSSMTRNFFLDDINKTLGVDAIKFSASGATTADLVKFFDLAKEAKGKSLKKVVLSLDIYSINKPAENAHYKEYDYMYRQDIREEYRYFLARRTYSHMWYLLKRKLRPYKKRKHQAEKKRMFSTEYDGMKFGKIAVMADTINNEFTHHTMTPAAPEIFEKNLNELLLPVFEKSPDIEFVVYLSPYHIYTYCLSEQFGEADALIKQRSYVMNKLLSYPNVKLYDYQGDRSIVCNDSYFSDIQHFSSAAARVVLKKLASGERRIISAADVAKNEAELRTLIAEYMPIYYSDLRKFKGLDK